MKSLHDCKSFVVCYCLHFLLALEVFCFQFCLQLVKYMLLDSGHVIDLTISLFCLKESFGLISNMLRVIVYLHCEALSDGYGNIWLNLSRQNCLKQIIQLLLSIVGSWAVHSLLHILFFTTSWSLSRVSIECCSRIVQAFYWTVKASFLAIWSLCFFRLTNANLMYWLWCRLRLWHRQTHLLEGVHSLVNCLEVVVLQQGENYFVIHHSSFTWSSESSGVPELTSIFFLLKNVQIVDLTIHDILSSLMGLF